jgi:RNA polymerase sigma-70 factor, ECF subfamily
MLYDNTDYANCDVPCNNERMENTESDLIHAARMGDDKALAQLIATHSRAIYNFSLRVLNDPARAEDVTQETFIKAWKHLAKFQPGKDFRTWLFAIAHNTAIDHVRKKRVLPFSFLSSHNENSNETRFEETLPDTEATPEEQAVLREEKEMLERAVAQLPSIYRAVLFLYYNEDLTFDEVGRVLNEPINTVKSRHRRALIALRAIVEKTAR